MKRAPAGLSALVLLLLLSGCDLFNAPVKDQMNLYSKAVYAESWDDLSAKMQNASDGTIFMLSGEYTADNTTIDVPGNVTIATAPGERAIIKRGTGFFLDGQLFFNVTGSLALGHAGGGELILDGGSGGPSVNTPAGAPLVFVYSGALSITKGVTLWNNNNSGTDMGGGGVCVDGGGSFTMTGGEISNNYNYTTTFGGGGVYIGNGSFTMSGGSISGNTAESSLNDAMGGGVYIESGAFNLKDGSVNGNTASSSHTAMGGGVCVATDDGTNGAFIMTGGSVTGNTAVSSNLSQGGGVFISGNGNESGSFTMTGGSIGDNTAQGNDNSRGGGGVYIAGWSGLGKSGNSVIYGYTEGDGNSNKVVDNNDIPIDDKGHAVCTGTAGYHGDARKEGTAGHGVDLFAGTRGGAYEYTGDWDYLSVP